MSLASLGDFFIESSEILSVVACSLIKVKLKETFEWYGLRKQRLLSEGRVLTIALIFHSAA